MKKLTIGIIGAGVMGKHHARIFSELPGIKLIGAADPDANALREITAKHSFKGFTDYRELLALRPDAVSIAVPPSRHAETALASINAGCHVLLEKPIAANSAEAAHIIRAARRRRVQLMVGHTERFNPAVALVKKALKGEKIISIDMTRVGPLPPRIKDVGIIIDLAIHDLDLVRYLSGSEVQSTRCLLRRVSGKHEDTAMILLKLKNGAMAHLTTNWLTPFKARSFQVATVRKFITADLIKQEVDIYSRIKTNEDGGLIRKLRPAYQEPLKLEIRSFINCIRKQTSVAVTGVDGLMALRLAEHCLKSCP